MLWNSTIYVPSQFSESYRKNEIYKVRQILNPKRNKTEFGTIRDCNTNSHKWSVVKAAMLCGAYPNLARVDESARHGIKIVTDQAKTYMMDYQSVCAKVTRQRHTKYHWFIFEEISQQLRGRVAHFAIFE